MREQATALRPPALQRPNKGSNQMHHLSAGRNLELQEQSFSLGILFTGTQLKHLLLPPIPGLNLNQLIQNSLAHQSHQRLPQG